MQDVESHGYGQAMHHAVSRGGSIYVGICCGAYLAGDTVVF